MKEAIRMVLEQSIYDSTEFPDTSHFRSHCRGHSAALRRIKEWGTSRWLFLLEEFECEHTIDRYRLPIFKEEIDDPKFFYSIQKVVPVFSAGLVEGPYSVPHSVLLSALLGNIYLHYKLDQEIGRIRHKYEISSIPTIVQRIRSVLLKTGRIDDQENYSGEASFNAPQDNRRAFIVGSIQRNKAGPFIPLFRTWHTLIRIPRGSGASAALNKPSSSLLCAFLFIEIAVSYFGFTPKAEFYGRERCNWAMRDFNKYCYKSYLIEPAILVIRSEASCSLIAKNRICYARYADDSLLGIVGAVELLIEIQKRIAHFLQSSGLNVNGSACAGSTIAASTIEFLGTVIRREVPPRTTPIQLLLRELEKRLRVKHRIHITAWSHLRSAIHSKFRNLNSISPKIKELTKGMSGTGSLLDARVQLETWSSKKSPSDERSVWGTKHIRQVGSRLHNSCSQTGRSNKVPTSEQAVSSGMSGIRARKGHWARSISEFPIQIEAPIKKILRRLRDRGLISRRPWPIHVVACLTNVSDGDIVNWSAGIAISPLSYYRCRDNLYQVRTIVDYQIRWSAIFTPAHKHKSSARNIIPKTQI